MVYNPVTGEYEQFRITGSGRVQIIDTETGEARTSTRLRDGRAYIYSGNLTERVRIQNDNYRIYK